MQYILNQANENVSRHVSVKAGLCSRCDRKRMESDGTVALLYREPSGLIDKRCEELIGRSLQSQRRETSVGMYSHEGCVFEGGEKLDTAGAYVKRVDASRRLRK